MVGRDSVVRCRVEDVREGFSGGLTLTITHLLQSLGVMRSPMVEVQQDQATTESGSWTTSTPER